MKSIGCEIRKAVNPARVTWNHSNRFNYSFLGIAKSIQIYQSILLNLGYKMKLWIPWVIKSRDGSEYKIYIGFVYRTILPREVLDAS